jgi:site-specific DNA-methyltransferase (adenine-specific)
MIWEILEGDCREVLATLEPESIDSIVTDPPYGLEFMGKAWDHGIPGEAFWAAALRVLKPGGHLVAFGGTRTYHRLTCAIEDAGFEIRDCLMWLYGSGFPKSLDVSKAIDKAAGAEREILGLHSNPATPRTGTFNASFGEATLTRPCTPAAKTWAGWGTALKPAWEPIILARKPIAGTVAANVLEHGTGGLDVDGCRIPAEKDTGWDGDGSRLHEGGLSRVGGEARPVSGRWPANVVLDEDAAEMLDAQSGTLTNGSRAAGVRKGLGYHGAKGDGGPPIDRSTGSASRFFYTAKASGSERNAGLVDRNTHPTVKPLALMRWLCRLVTPPGGLVLDPFAGSGSTIVAALREGFSAIGIEKEAEYAELARVRIEEDMPLFRRGG